MSVVDAVELFLARQMMVFAALVETYALMLMREEFL